MPLQFEECSQIVAQLSADVDGLRRATAEFELPPLPQREWFELLNRKLKPQLGELSFLIVAVVGGTNIGKSVIFNHIAGGRISATSPMASGTKHPTALIPRTLQDRVQLEKLFQGFQVERWEDARQPLQEDATHRLFYRLCDDTPPNLIILDTPDIDSVSEVNWARADYVRQSADVLIAVLTQQKYNDAAVKQFFRKAAQEDKLVIVIFNQCQLPEDEEYWPLWLQTFCSETGVQPHLIYLAPSDRRAAESNSLPFFERDVTGQMVGGRAEDRPHRLVEDLSQLHFGDIKVRTLAGALRHLVSPEWGIPSWLQEIQCRSREFQEALELLSSHRLVEISRWPLLPNAVLIEALRAWWRAQRQGWSAAVHGFYNRLGEAVTYPVTALRRRAAPAPVSPLETYRQREWEAILDVLQRCIERLEWLRELGNPLLSPRLDRLLGGTSRSALIERIRQEHEQIDFQQEIQQLIERELQNFQSEHPESYRLIRRIDSLAAATRPAVSVALFVTGAGPLGDAVAPVVAASTLSSILHIAGDAVGGTVVTAVGDKVITSGAATSVGYLEARFRQLHAAFARQRAAWMAGQLEKHLLGDLTKEFSASSRLINGEEFRRVRQSVDQLRKILS